MEEKDSLWLNGVGYLKEGTKKLEKEARYIKLPRMRGATLVFKT